MAGRRISVARCSFFLPDKGETPGTPSLRRETRRPHREEVICLGFFGVLSGFLQVWLQNPQTTAILCWLMASMLLRGFSQNIPTGSGSCGLQGSSEILVEYKLLSLSLSLSLSVSLSLSLCGHSPGTRRPSPPPRPSSS